MKKIPSLFKRVRETHLVYNEITEGCEWALKGEGVATIKIDGTCCKMEDGALYKRYDRKLTKKANKLRKKDKAYKLSLGDFKSAPEGFEPCEPTFDPVTGHWPGWVKVDENDPNDKWHIEALNQTDTPVVPFNGTCELVGPKIKANPYNFTGHLLAKHGDEMPLCDRSYSNIRQFLEHFTHEGLVFYHPDGRMCKVKRSDFGFEWPIKGLGL